MSKTVLMTIACLLSIKAFSQQRREMSIKDLAELVVKEHPAILTAQKDVAIAEKAIEVAKLDLLPSIVASTQQFYFGDAMVINKDFSGTEKVPMPHYGSDYTIRASQLIFDAGKTKTAISLADINRQVTMLKKKGDEINVKFLAISLYLDIYRTSNQRKVLDNNLLLSQQRLLNIQKFYEQGMITRNEVIRANLSISNLQQNIFTLANNLSILSYNLDVNLGLPTDTQIIPTQSLDLELADQEVRYYQEIARKADPGLNSSKLAIEMADKSIKITGSEKLPTISTFAGYNMKRPVTIDIPALDVYFNSWQAGIMLTYNIDNLYKTRKKIGLSREKKERSEENYKLIAQNLDMEVNSSFSKFREAQKLIELKKEAENLAVENYRITEQKYLNHLVMQTEMIDAQNQKVQAELDYNDAKINALFQYYKLLKTIGTL